MGRKPADSSARTDATFPGATWAKIALPVRDERARCERQPASEAAVAGGGLDLEGALQATGQAPADDEHAELLGIGEHPEVGPVPGGAPHAVVTTEVVARRELEIGVVGGRRGHDEVAAAGFGPQPLRQPQLERRVGPRRQVAGRQRVQDVVGGHVRRHHQVGGEVDDGVGGAAG